MSVSTVNWINHTFASIRVAWLTGRITGEQAAEAEAEVWDIYEQCRDRFVWGD